MVGMMESVLQRLDRLEKPPLEFQLPAHHGLQHPAEFQLPAHHSWKHQPSTYGLQPPSDFQLPAHHSWNHQPSTSGLQPPSNFQLPAQHSWNHQASITGRGRQEIASRHHYKRSQSLQNKFSNFRCYNNKDKVKANKVDNYIKNIKSDDKARCIKDNINIKNVNHAENVSFVKDYGNVKDIRKVGKARNNYFNNDKSKANKFSQKLSHALVDYDSDSDDEDTARNQTGVAPPTGYTSSEDEADLGDYSNVRDEFFSEPEYESEEDIQDYNLAGDRARLKDIRLLFSDIQSSHPQYFIQNFKDLPFYQNPDSIEAKKYILREKEIPFLKIAPDLTGSWLDPNHYEGQNDSIAIWAPDTKFPTKSKLYPKDYSMRAPPRIPYLKVEDPLLDKFIKAPPLNAANLDPSVFGSCSFPVNKFTHSKVDSILRGSLVDCFTSDEIIKILITLVAKVDEEHRALGGSGHISTLDPIMQLLLLGAETNVRMEQQVISALVANKVGLRERVLYNFSMPSSTRNILKCTNFLSDKLFGDLPESFKSLVISENGKHLRARHKSNKSFQNNSAFSTNGFGSASNPSSFFGRPRFGNRSRPLKRLQGSAGRFNKRSAFQKKSQFFRGQGRRGRR